MRRDRCKHVVFYATLLALGGLCAFRTQLGENGPATMAAALLAFAILNWILETAPVAVVSLAVIAFVPCTGLMSFEAAVKGSFGNSIFGFFLGVLLMSFAFRDTDLGRLISKGIFRLFGSRPRAIVLGIMIAGRAACHVGDGGGRGGDCVSHRAVYLGQDGRQGRPRNPWQGHDAGCCVGMCLRRCGDPDRHGRKFDCA